MTLDEAIEKELWGATSQYNAARSFHTAHEVDLEGACKKESEYQKQLAEWLKELKQYKEKDTPKLVIYSGDGYADGYMVYDYAECPNCERGFEDGRDEWEMPFCCACGQALKWEVEE